jgi:hypothetical protein
MNVFSPFPRFEPKKKKKKTFGLQTLENIQEEEVRNFTFQLK